ncbi:hypothetical protein GHU66_22205 [Pseudomonas aeruginosa]|nr:hypothetical protein [Pseudomonas aeruginosa]
MQARKSIALVSLSRGRIFAARSIRGVVQAVLQVPAKALDPDLHTGFFLDELADIAGGETLLSKHRNGGLDLVKFGADSVRKAPVFSRAKVPAFFTRSFSCLSI